MRRFEHQPQNTSCDLLQVNGCDQRYIDNRSPTAVEVNEQKAAIGMQVRVIPRRDFVFTVAGNANSERAKRPLIQALSDLVFGHDLFLASP